jgi:hypothetical protein
MNQLERSKHPFASSHVRLMTTLMVVVIAACAMHSAADDAGGAGAKVTTQANVVKEIRFEASTPHADPFNDVTLDAVFTDPSGATLRVPAFWAGGNFWKVRYASGVVGAHRFRTECSDPRDAGLHGVEGRVQVEPYDGENALYRHGPLRVAADRRHFEYADGQPFLWIGDTWWMGLCKRLHWPDEFQALASDRKEKGFNVLQIVAGLYPDQGAFDERGANEAGFPWEKDYVRIRPEYFDAADRRIEWLVDQGFVPCIVGAWGYHLPWLGEEKMKQHLRYLVARWGAMPVVWCAAGEFNLPYYLAPGFPKGGQKQAAQWAEVIRYLRTINAFGRPITAHPTGIEPLSARLVLKGLRNDERLLDFDMLQTGHGLREVLGPTVSTLRASYGAAPAMPVVNGEVAYEALNGRIPADVPRLMCWACLLSGAAGHTYGANGIWQLNRKAEPYGNSPHGGNYGPIPWDEAMNLPGSRQVGLAGKLLASLPFQKFEPHPDWAAWKKPASDKFLVPYAAGIPRVLRVIYVPTADPIVVRDLESGIRYAGRQFDPVSGKSANLDLPQRGDSGSLTISAPPGWDHDWVVILDARATHP